MDTQNSDDRLLWYAARTRYGQELGIKRKLAEKGIETFIPTHTVKTPGGKKVEKPMVTNLVFLKTTKSTALDLANNQGLPVKYMIDCTTHTMLVVPEKQMTDFMKVFDFSIEEGGLLEEQLSLGESIRVSTGPLAGVEGKVLEMNGKVYVVVGLINSVFAKARVPRAWIEKI